MKPIQNDRVKPVCILLWLSLDSPKQLQLQSGLTVRLFFLPFDFFLQLQLQSALSLVISSQESVSQKAQNPP